MAIVITDTNIKALCTVFHSVRSTDGSIPGGDYLKKKPLG